MTKVSDELLHEIRTIDRETSRVIADLGAMSYRIHLMQRELDETKREYEQMMAGLDVLADKDRAIAERLSKEYGQGTVNIDTGDFEPSVASP